MFGRIRNQTIINIIYKYDERNSDIITNILRDEIS